MASFDYDTDIDLRLPLVPDVTPSDDIAVFNDVNVLYNALRLLASGTTERLATKLSDAPSDGKTYGRQDAQWVEVTGGGGGGGDPSVVKKGTGTFLEFTDLDLIADFKYEITLALRAVNTGTTTTALQIVMNDDTVVSNYSRTRVTANGSVFNDNYILDGNNYSAMWLNVHMTAIQQSGGYPQVMPTFVIANSTTVGVNTNLGAVTLRKNVASVTKIRFNFVNSVYCAVLRKLPPDIFV